MKAPKVLADIVESVAGAIYVDVNFDLQRLWVVGSWIYFWSIITISLLVEHRLVFVFDVL